MTEHLSINFLPNAIYKPELCIRTTLEAARVNDFPLDRIIFEVTEGERIEDGPWFAEILREYKRSGFKTAIDDFGIRLMQGYLFAKPALRAMAPLREEAFAPAR